MTGVDLSSLPKVLLHDHLDGGLRVDTVIDLAAESGYDALPTTTPNELADWFYQGAAGSLEQYLEAFRHTVGVMQSEAALRRVAYEAVLDLADDGVVYAEIRLAPSLHLTDGLRREQVIEAVLEGLSEGSKKTEIVVGLILDAMRDQTDSEEIAGLAVAYQEQGVVGFDLAGPEAGYPADDHLAACRIARQAGLGLSIHAGEGDGPESIRKAVQRCGAQRLGHGVRIVEDTEMDDGRIVALGRLAESVRERRIPLEVCPTSELHTGIYPSLSKHSVAALHRAGFVVTLNTDNRLMSRVSLTGEFEVVAETHGFDIRDFRTVTVQALEAGFADRATRRELLEERVLPVYDKVS